MRDHSTAVWEETAEPVRSSGNGGGRRAARKKKKAALLWTLWGLLVLVVLGGLGFGLLTVRYQDHFYPRSHIDGVDVSGMSVAEATAALARAGENVSLRLYDGEEEIGTLPLSELMEENVLLALAGDAFSQQHSLSSPVGWIRGATWRHTGAVIGYPETEALGELLEDRFYGAAGVTEPEDAHLEYTEGGYILIPEVKGNRLDEERCAQALAAAVAGESDLTAREIGVEAPGGRVLPQVTEDDPQLLSRQQELNQFLDITITVDFQDGNVYTLTPEDISAVSEITWEDGGAVCTPDPEKVRALTDQLADNLGLDGVYAKFHNVVPTRELIYYRVGDKGWRMDHDRLAREVTEAIAEGRDATVVPAYDRTWYWEGYYHGLGNTFVEISIDNQYLWYYVDGDLLVETPVVTGNLAAGDYTRRGCFKIYGMTTDTVLTGPTWNDHVDYWMPFDGGIGLHDSSWRDEYGGDIYIENGSHGCINTPLEAIATIYENIWKGVPVVVY